MHNKWLLVALLLVLGWPTSGRGQSLADVARAEEARRKAVKQPSKVYTNENLRRDGDGDAATAAPPVPAPSAPPKPGEAAKQQPVPPADDSKQDEKFWRNRITVVRQTLEHDKVLIDALQSRINALTTDFTNTSDPAQRAVVEENRKTAIAEMDRLTKDLEKQTKALADIQEEARKAAVPPGWLR